MFTKIKSIIKKGLIGLLTLTLFATQAMPANANLVFTNDVFTNDATIFRIGADKNASSDTMTLEFGGTNTKSFTWDTSKFNIGSDIAITGGASVTSNIDLNLNQLVEGRIENLSGGPACDSGSSGRLYQNTVSGYSFICNGTSWIRIDDSTVPSGDDTFESVYANDGDSGLITTNGAFTINTGTNDFIVDSNDWNVDSSGNLDGNNITANGILDANGVVTIGDNGDSITLDSSAWDINSAGVGSGFTGFTSTGTINFSGAGAFRLREVAGLTNPGTACTTTGELIMDTNDNTLYVCTNAGTDAWSKVSSSGDATTLDTIDSTQFLRSDTSDNYTSGTLTLDNGTTLTVNGVANIGDNGDTVAIDSSDWDISTTGAMTGISGITNDSTFTTSGGAVNVNASSNNATNINTGTSTGAVSIGGNANTVAIDSSAWDITTTGAMTGIGAITMDGLLTGTAGATLSGAVVSLNDSSNFATNIGTGTSTGAVSVGGGANTVAVNSTSWDISTAGVASGLTGITSTGNIVFTGATSFRPPQAASAPGTCSVGQIYYNTTTNDFWGCTTTNTWTVIPELSSLGSSGQILRSNATSIPSWSTATYPATAGTAGNILRSDGTNFVSTAVTSSQSTPANPTGTTSTSGVMMGLAGSITPARSGIIHINISGNMTNNTITAKGASAQIRTGTGTAPANGAALTGTAQGSAVSMLNPSDSRGGTITVPFSLNAIVTGLAVGIAVWIDINLAAITGGTASIANVNISTNEL